MFEAKTNGYASKVNTNEYSMANQNGIINSILDIFIYCFTAVLFRVAHAHRSCRTSLVSSQYLLRSSAPDRVEQAEWYGPVASSSPLDHVMSGLLSVNGVREGGA